ncbi:ArnT family glycosyltransferase [Elusimicrobiota bacterium]
MKKKQINSAVSSPLIPEFPFIVISSLWLFFIVFKFFSYHQVDLNQGYLFSMIGEFNFKGFISLLVQYSFSTVILAGIVSGAFYVGDIILNGLLCIKTDTKLERLVFAIGIGFGVLGYMTFFLGLSGLLYQSVFYPIWLFLTVAGIMRFKRTGFQENVYRISSPSQKIIFIVLLLPVVFNMLMSFTPEMFYDSLNYHMGLPNYYMVHHRIQELPYKTNSHYPILISMLYLNGIVLKSEMVAKLINFSFGIMTIAAIIVFSLRHFKSLTGGLVAAMAYYFIPNVLYRNWTATTDMGLTMFLFLSLSALMNSFSEDKNKWLILSAILAGFGAASKYTGVFFIFGMSILIFSSKHKTAIKLKKFILWNAIWLIVFSPWLVKNYVESGNPAYPFFTRYFTVKYPHIRNDNYTQEGSFDENPFANIEKRSFSDFWRLPWDLSIKAGGAGKYSSADYYMIGAVFIAFIPLIILLKRKHQMNIYRLIIFLFFSYIFWNLFARGKIKYYAPAFPALAAITGYAVSQIKTINKKFAAVAIMICILMSLYNFIYMIPIAHTSYKPFSIDSSNMSAAFDQSLRFIYLLAFFILY